MASDVKETLEKALAEMKQRGRTCKTLLTQDGKCCALGAVGLALEIEESALRTGSYVAYEALQVSEAVKALGDLLPDYDDYTEAPHRKVYNFNDDFETTDEDVYALFERAIEVAS